MKKIILAAIIALLGINALYSDNYVVIDGTVTINSFNSATLIDVATNDQLAQTEVKNNKFEFKTQIGEEKVLAIMFSKQNYIIVDVKPGDRINLTYDPYNFQNNKVEGSEATDFYIQSVIKLMNIDKNKQEKFIDSLVKQNTDKLINLLFLQSLDLSTYSKTYDFVLDKMKSYSKSALYKQVQDAVNSDKLTRIGSIPPEIELLDTAGNMVKLSSLRGQYVLVDFWASWCRPCRMESPNIVRAYNKYHNKGFTIYSVSLDYNRKNWLDAIHKDGLGQWTHVSDLKGWNSIAAQKYGVRSIPSNFLLDKEGHIIAKNLRGSSLEKKLQEIFK